MPGPLVTPAPTFDLTGNPEAYVLRLLWLLCRDPEARAIAVFHHDGIPVPKARARATKAGHHYTPANVTRAEDDLAVMFQVYVRRRPIAGPLALVSLFFMPDHRRIDGDNCQKLVMDAATKAGVWHDDSQVTASTWFMEHDSARPRTVIGARAGNQRVAATAAEGAMNGPRSRDAARRLHGGERTARIVEAGDVHDQ